MIETIKNRIRNGYYETNELTEEEILYIRGNDELVDELREHFRNNETANIKIPSNIDISAKRNLYFILDEILEENTDKTNMVNLFYNYALLECKAYGFDLDFCTLGLLTDEETTILENKTKEYILNTDDDVKIYFDDSTIDFVIENKRFDLLYKFRDVSMFDDEAFDKIIKVFPFGRYPVPDCLLLEHGNLRINNTPIDRILKKLVDNKSSLGDDKEKINSFYHNLLTSMANIHQKYDCSVYQDFNDIIYEDEEILDTVPGETVVELASSGFLNTTILRYLESNHLSNKEQCLNYIYRNIERSNNPYKYLKLVMDYISPYGLKNKKSGYIYESFLNKMIDGGYGLFFLINNKDNYGLSEKYIKRIKESIYNGNNKIKNIDTLVFDNVYDDKELFRLLIDKDFSIDKIHYSHTYWIMEFDYEMKQSDERYYDLKELIIKKQSKCSLEWCDTDILNMYLKKKNYDNIYSIYKDVSINEKKKIEEWLELNTDNVLLLDTFMINLKSNIDIIKIALKNKNLVKNAMEIIIHNDKLIDRMDNDIYEMAKEYYANKYKLNVHNMDLLASNLGPKILLHLEDENLQKIINLNEEELKKIISLFPMEGNLIDIEATHESIMQYAFKQDENNREDADLFTYLKKSIVEKKLDNIEKYKYKIMSLIDLDYFNKLKKNTENIEYMNLEETLDYLIINFDNKELRELLHSLTTNAISTKRKLYVGNKYFMDSEEFKNSSLYRLNNKIIDNYNIITKLGINNDLVRKSENAINNANIDYIFDSMSKESKNKLLRKYNYSDYEEMKKSIMNNLDKPKSYFLLEEMMNDAITYAKANSKGDYSVFAQLKIDYDLEEKSKRNEVEKFIIKNCRSIYKGWYECLSTLIEDELEKQGISKDLTKDIINYYRDPKNIKDCYHDENEIKKKIGIFFKTATQIIREDYNRYANSITDEDSCIRKLDEENLIKRIYKFDTSKSDVYSILSLLNIDLIRENVLNDDRNYNLLLKIMNKTKVHLLGNGVSSFIDEYSLPVTSDFKDLSAYINYFGDIVKKEEENLVKKGITTSLEENIPSIVSVLIQSGIYASVNSIYSKVLGVEDSKLIKANPSPNTAITKTKNNERLNQAIEDTIKCFERKKILVPTFDDIITLSEEENKKLEVIVGNFTAPCNLTHGERTGACMRIGGVGEELYDFCLNNNAGFHIRFEDPETHKYISRVSCFRNGNTVYFNQLRDSLDEKYSDNELFETTKIIANRFIELTKESDNPIENVFVTDGYAVSETKNVYHLDYNNVVGGLGKIYTDYSYGEAILLATTAEKDYVPLKAGNKNIKPYKVQRTKPREYMNPIEATGVINRISSVKQLLNGVDVSDIMDLEFDSDIIYAIASDDWYIYVDNNMQIKTDIIDNSIDSVLERNTFMSLLEQQIKQGEFKEVSYGL